MTKQRHYQRITAINQIEDRLQLEEISILTIRLIALTSLKQKQSQISIVRLMKLIEQCSNIEEIITKINFTKQMIKTNNDFCFSFDQAGRNTINLVSNILKWSGLNMNDNYYWYPIMFSLCLLFAAYLYFPVNFCCYYFNFRTQGNISTLISKEIVKLLQNIQEKIKKLQE